MRGKGFTLIEVLIVVAIIGILAAIAVPNLQDAIRRSKYSRAAADTKIATTQTITYAGDTGVYPTSINVLRHAGYASVSVDDPWGIPYQLSPSLTSGLPPTGIDDVYIFSQGPVTSGTYPNPFVTQTGLGGSVGYSSIYGAWAGY
jgi:prepilin-type N-terminal cleavage/methylation domain-containing protein